MEHAEAGKTFYLSQILSEPLIYRFKISTVAGNTYIVCSDEELLIIDPPVRSMKECQLFLQAVNTLSVTCETYKLFFTHSHEMDFSLISHFFSKETVVYISKYENIPTVYRDPLQYQNARYLHEGYPQELLAQWDAHTEVPLLEEETIAFVYLGDGDCIGIGRENLQCLYTPGHTSGHMCLWLEKAQILFAGDIFLYEQLPCVSMWDENDNEIEILLKSLDKLKSYSVSNVLPAHGSIGENYMKRLEEIERQFYVRILHMYRLVYDYPSSNAYELCRYFYQNSDHWGDAIPQKKWHAMGETLSFLNYLRNKNYVAVKRGKNGIINIPGKHKLTDI